MASLRCYDNCDVIETLIVTSFHLYLIQLCSPPAIFQIFVYSKEFILKRRRYWPWITAPSHKCNNKLDCFLHEMLLITDSFFIKSNLQEPLKNVFSVRDLGLENIFSIIIKRLLISTFSFQFRHLEVLFFCIYNGMFKLAMMILLSWACLVIFIMSFKPLAINLQYTLLIKRAFYLCKSHW